MQHFSDKDLEDISRFKPETDDHLHFWIRVMLNLDIPRKPICPDHQAPFDYVRDAYFQKFTDAVIWANRGGGKTMLGAAVSLLDAVCRPGTAIRILGGSLEQSQKMYRYLTGMVQRRFTGQLEGGAGVAKTQAGRGRGRSRGMGAPTLRFANGSEVEILAQSERSVRGNRVQKMRCDEIELFDSDVWTSCQLVTESREESRIGDCGLPNETGGGDGNANPKSEIRN